jgi:hypothetical protein
VLTLFGLIKYIVVLLVDDYTLEAIQKFKGCFPLKIRFFSFKVLTCFGLSTLIFFFLILNYFLSFFLNKKTLKK